MLSDLDNAWHRYQEAESKSPEHAKAFAMMCLAEAVAKSVKSERKENRERPRPIGSGIFALITGLLFAVCAFSIYPIGISIQSISMEWVLFAWATFASAILCLCGLVRILTGDKQRLLVVGQSTLNFVVAIIAATFALLALALPDIAIP